MIVNIKNSCEEKDDFSRYLSNTSYRKDREKKDRQEILKKEERRYWSVHQRGKESDG